MSVDHLPDAPLDVRYELAARFDERGVRDYRSAARYVMDLPYGRNSDRSNHHLVLAEGRGTCSTKHALLAALALEQGIDVELRIGIYAMDATNTPGVGEVLQKYGIPVIPEAHCYLAYRDRRVDVTSSASVRVKEFVAEETISPAQIGAHKVGMHRAFVERWAKEVGLDPDYAWRVREECIAALSRAT